MTDYDPRVYFAAERTLLAWVRTGLALMGFGFVVSRFGLMMRLIQPDAPYEPSGLSHYVGVLMVMMGTIVMVIAAIQHIRFSRTLTPAERPRSYLRTPGVWVCGVLATVGVMLMVALIRNVH